MAERRLAPGAVEQVTVAAGALRQITPDSLALYYELLTRDTPAAGSRLQVRQVPITARCRACGWEGPVELPVFRCGGCNDPGIDVLTGRELLVESMQVADEVQSGLSPQPG